MRREVSRDLTDSARDFETIVWPEIKHWCRGGRLVQMEDPAALGLAKDWDTLAGIDAWQVVQDVGIRGIASRVQWSPKPWHSFTVRTVRSSGYTTEMEKRLGALREDAGWLFPALTVQAYLPARGRGPLLYACMARTMDLYTYVENHRPPTRVNPVDGNVFSVLWVDNLRAHGVNVKETTI